MSYVSLIFVFVVLLIVIGFPALVFLTALLEKQYLKRDMAPVVGRSPYPVLPYSIAMKGQAGQLGFVHCGDHYTRKDASIVRGNSSLWLSADRRILCQITDGKFAGIAYRKTRLWARLQDGRILETTDETGTVQLSRIVLTLICCHGDLFELLAVHEGRPEFAGGDCHEFDPRQAQAQLEEIEMARGRQLVADGLAYFYNENRGIIRYTFRGALKVAAGSMLGNRKDLQPQKERMSMKRPGDPGYTPSRTDAPGRAR